MLKVTGEEVKAAMLAANITRVDHHDCGGCGDMVFYSRAGDELYFHSACSCVRFYSPPKHMPWDDAANFINMQSNDEVRNKLRAAFGLPSEV